jgi:hypothetical protein
MWRELSAGVRGKEASPSAPGQNRPIVANHVERLESDAPLLTQLKGASNMDLESAV